MPRGNPSGLSLGPGYLFWGPLGSVEPTDLTTPWTSVDPDWLALGYTTAGSEFHSQTSADPVEVAEELLPIEYAETGRMEHVDFSLAQLTATNLRVAFNGGNITTSTGLIIFEAPDLGQSVRAMIGFEAEDHTERWVFRQCYQAGEIVIMRQKGATNAAIPGSFNLEKPATGLRSWRALLASPQRT